MDRRATGGLRSALVRGRAGRWVAAACVALLAAPSPASGLAGAMAADAESRAGAERAALPHPAHVVIVIEENKGFDRVIGNPAAPYINALAGQGALFTDSHAVAHPSQPNYLALFSGGTHGVRDDQCPIDLTGPNLATELIGKGLAFAIYSESLPVAGYAGCFADGRKYARKHNPAVDWQGQGLPPDVNLPFAAFPDDYRRLPEVSIVVPNQIDDMHDGASSAEQVRRGDAWLKQNLAAYVKWAESNNSLLILTWDEDEGTQDNRVATLFIGPMVRNGTVAARITHYDVLRTIEDIYGVSHLGHSASARPILGIWRLPERDDARKAKASGASGGEGHRSP
jgi:hypothetical protein